MKGNYNQVPVFNATTRFDKAPQSEAERSRMGESVPHITAFNAGDIVPVGLIEVLPSETYSIDVESIIRQTTLKLPTMGEMVCDVCAFFVPNRIVNRSWVNVQGENSSGSWNAPEVQLAPLYTGSSEVQIPVGSVADFYGIPTQRPMPASVLNLMSDLPFRGYLAIYNEYYRDENYQAPLTYSKNNVYEGFLLPSGSAVPFSGGTLGNASYTGSSVSDGSYAGGSLIKEIYGEGFSSTSDLSGAEASGIRFPARKSAWSALDKPLKANRFHDALSTVLPSPQKGPAVTFSLADSAPVAIPEQDFRLSAISSSDGIEVGANSSIPSGSTFMFSSRGGNTASAFGWLRGGGSDGSLSGSQSIIGLHGNADELTGTADLSKASAISVDDLRLGFAMQQLYELYGRSGSRYRELCHAMFGIDVDDPFSDVPRMLGRVRFPLELYQTAQTSSTDSESPQGNLAGFGYTNKGGFLFHETFLEHGYVHILCTIRQRNIYPSYLAPHWFRLNKLDFYTPILANISEQPIMLRTINPFASDNPNSTVFGYQEAWWEYRQHPAMATGLMRSGASANVSSWTYQDIFDASLSSADADWRMSNAQEVLDNTLAVTSENAPQFKALFMYKIDHEFPGPVYSVPGLDVV